MDPEIKAMGDVSGALETLEDDDSRSRVLRWAAERYGVTLGTTGGRSPKGTGHGAGDVPEVRIDDHSNSDAPSGPSEKVFTEFVDLFDAADPKTEPDKALTAAYWLQVIQANPSWQGQQVNNLLKDLGHGLANVTKSTTSLQSKKPALVRQVSKSGRAQQSRKTYKLTTSGVSHVRAKLGLGSTVPPSLADDGSDE